MSQWSCITAHPKGESPCTQRKCPERRSSEQRWKWRISSCNYSESISLGYRNSNARSSFPWTRPNRRIPFGARIKPRSWRRRSSGTKCCRRCKRSPEIRKFWLKKYYSEVDFSGFILHRIEGLWFFYILRSVFHMQQFWSIVIGNYIQGEIVSKFRIQILGTFSFSKYPKSRCNAWNIETFIRTSTSPLHSPIIINTNCARNEWKWIVIHLH